MSWKKNFARNIRFGDLPEIGIFKIGDTPPEALGKGKYRVMLELADGTKAQLSTFEGTVGDLIYTNPKTGWLVAYKETVDGQEYIRFKVAEAKKEK